MSEKFVEEGRTPEGETPSPRNSGVKRPLVPLVLALMGGLAAAAWGVQIPKIWLAAGLAGLLVVMVWLYVKQRTAGGSESPKEPQ